MTGEKEIYVLGKRVWLRQPENGFRTSLDSVMLAAACPAKKSQSVLDLGCGVGGAGLCVMERVNGLSLTGVDIQRECVELARENAAKNGHDDSCEFINADIREFQGGPFNHVICNPPYLEHGAHTPSPHKGKAISNGHVEETNEGSLEDWIRAGFRNLKSRGSFTIIHRADMLGRIIQELGRRFGAIEVIPLWPRFSEPAKRVIVRAVKDSKSPASMLPGIVLHEKDGSYTEHAERILRDGHPIP
jgi:tRNA1(Val) A37 N6-methylase TrmN6